MTDPFYRTSIFMGGVTVLLLSLSTASFSAEKLETQESTAVSVADLQQQRLELLERLVVVAREGYLQGDINYEEFVAAQQQVISAKLEMTDDRASRLALLTESVKLAETLAKRTEELFALGKVTQREVLVYRADFLTAKIRLEQERSE